MLTKKKILAFVLLLAVAAPLLFFAGFLVKQKMIQHQMKERLESASLQTISIDGATIQWIKKDKEVMINGRPFDVKSYDYSGNKVIITGLFDEDEKELNTRLRNIITHTNHTPSPLDNLIKSFFFSPINTVNSDFAISGDWCYISTKYGQFSVTIPSSPCQSFLQPPKVL